MFRVVSGLATLVNIVGSRGLNVFEKCDFLLLWSDLFKKPVNRWYFPLLEFEHFLKIFVHLFICVFIHVHACVCTRVCTCVCICVYVYACVCVCTRGKVRGQLSGIWPLFTPGEWNSFVGRWPYPRAWIVLSSAFWILPPGRFVCKIGIWAMRVSSSFSDQASNLWNALIGGISGWQRGSYISKGTKKIKDKRRKLEVVAMS